MHKILKKANTFIANQLDNISNWRHTIARLKTTYPLKLYNGIKRVEQKTIAVIGVSTGIIIATGTFIICYKNKIIDAAENIRKKIFGTTTQMDQDEIFIQQHQATMVEQEKKIASYESLLNELRQIPVDDDVLKHLNALGICEYDDATISINDVNKAYRRIAQKFHPDSIGNNDAFHAISEAKESLLNKVDNIMIMEIQNHIELLEESNRNIKKGIEQFTILCDQIEAFNSKQIQSSTKAMDEKEHTTDDTSENSEEKTSSYQYNTF